MKKLICISIIALILIQVSSYFSYKIKQHKIASYVSMFYLDNKVWNIKKLENNFYDTLQVNNIEIFKPDSKKEYVYKNLILVKTGNNCFVYKIPIAKVITEKDYNSLWVVRTLIWTLWGYNNLNTRIKTCKIGDYEKCNVYVTEKWTIWLKPYECK